MKAIKEKLYKLFPKAFCFYRRIARFVSISVVFVWSKLTDCAISMSECTQSGGPAIIRTYYLSMWRCGGTDFCTWCRVLCRYHFDHNYLTIGFVQLLSWARWRSAFCFSIGGVLCSSFAKQIALIYIPQSTCFACFRRQHDQNAILATAEHIFPEYILRR